MMARPACLLSALLIGLATVHAVPVQLQGGLNVLRHDEYAPASSDYVPRYLESYGGMEQRNLDDIGGGHMLRQTRRGFDSSSGFGDARRYLPLRRMNAFLAGHPGNVEQIDRSNPDRFAKRNIDEIDRTAFDSFFKRNFDEIDRVGWDGFVKRFDDYPAGKHRL